MKLNLLFALGLLAFASNSRVAAEVAEEVVQEVPEEPAMDAQAPPFVPTTIQAPFLEQFTKATGSRWIASETKKIVDGVEDDELLRYRGQWSIEEPSVFPALAHDEGLTVKTAAAHHAISAAFPSPIDNTGKTLVVQYEVKLQNGLECGGAYMKLLTYDPAFEPSKFDDKSPYTISELILKIWSQ
ncbi:hypothetical protein HDU76_000389, partial [Blyttiomyces sp. JEL0837]